MVHPGQNPSEILAQLLAVTTRIHHVYLVWVMPGFTTLVNISDSPEILHHWQNAINQGQLSCLQVD